jgi:hypothetical protein
MVDDLPVRLVDLGRIRLDVDERHRMAPVGVAQSLAYDKAVDSSHNIEKVQKYFVYIKISSIFAEVTTKYCAKNKKNEGHSQHPTLRHFQGDPLGRVCHNLFPRCERSELSADSRMPPSW